jgi:PEP-CTERM motif
MNKPVSSLLRILLVALTFAAALPASAAMQGSAAGAPAAATFDTCSWDRPGVDPFMGDVVAAVDRYQDIAPDVRARLKTRMVKRDYDDVVSIRRDSITGRAKARYGSAIRDMHFGAAKVCHSVSRAAWSAQMQERGLVYCESGHCILVPTVCRNVSRIARAEVAHEHAEGDVPEIESPPVAALDLLPMPMPVDLAPTPLAMDAGPGAETSPDGHAQGTGGSGGAGGGGGAHGSFASGSGEANIASSGGKGDGGTPPQTPPNLQLAPTVTPVPEPETWGLMIGGLAALAAWRRRRR